MKKNKKKVYPERGRRVFVGMSGGVDSSVAAALLKERGFDVVGVHLKCYNVDGCAEQDAEDARRAAETLKIPFYVFDMEQEYKDKVVEYMVDGYKKGITPNPDVMCNKEIKFGLFLEKALELGADYVATGHYVRLRQSRRHPEQREGSHEIPRYARNDNYRLYSAVDKNKDQSYFLWTLSQKQLKHSLFPIGDYVKPEVRKLARRYKLPNADKKDSQGICFLGQVTLKDFLGGYIPEKKGIIVNTAGEVVGEHKGAQFYTIGQRGGLGIGGSEKPYYVAEKDMKENALLVAEEGDPALFKKEIELTNVNLLNKESRVRNKEVRIPVMARVRYRQPLASASFIIHNSSCKLVFAKPQKFVAVGQSAVFYAKSGEMLGGGVIS